MLRWPLLYFEVAFLVHALSHFVVARVAGLTVATFAIGMGPRIFRFNHRGTTYQLNLIPLGAYNVIDLQSGPALARGRLSRSLAAVAAGPLGNFILSSACLMLVAMFFGVASGVSNKIGTLVPGFPAAQAGLRAGDKVVMIDGAPMSDGETVVRTIRGSNGHSLAFTIERDGVRSVVHVTPRYDERQKVWLTGLSPSVVRRLLDPVPAVGWGAKTTLQDMVAYWAGLWHLLRPTGQSFELSGPMVAMSVLSQAAIVHPETVLFLLAFASTITVALNLLPVPPLDCGRAVLLLAGRQLDPRRERQILLVGIGLLLCLVIALTVRDLLHPVRIPLP